MSLSQHRLQPLLAPRSVAVVGASTGAGSFGHRAITELVAGGFSGNIYPINPRYESVEGYCCYESLQSLDETPELVQFCIANQRVETEVELAASLGVRAAIIYGSCYLPQDSPGNTLLGRLTSITRDAGIQVCGGNCMGYRNLHGGVLAGIYQTSASDLKRGPAVLISHSGTAFSVLTNLDGRIGFELSVSAGQELATTAADYLDYALDIPGIRCVVMFLETIRDPLGFSLAVARAHQKNMAVVVLKVGRSDAAAKFAMSHSGALVGDHAAYLAFFERHGIINVDSLDELVNVMQLLAYGKRLAKGGLSAALDSGGKRELLVDTAQDVKLPLAELDAATVATLSANLEPDLEPVNPLDHWGTGGDDWLVRLVTCITALANDQNSALCAIVGSIAWYDNVIKEVAAHTDKPLAIITDFLRTRDIESSLTLNQDNIAVLVGERASLMAIKAVMKYRDYHLQPAFVLPATNNPARTTRWQKILAENASLDEATSIELMTDYGLTGPVLEIVEDEAAALAAAHRIGYPVVLKTAMPDITHKSDVDGVRLNIQDDQSLLISYRDLSNRLGARALVERQAANDGIEMALGMVRDPLLGALVMIGAGGTLVEMLDDKVCVPAPSSRDEVARAIDRLKCRPLLDAHRGKPGVDREALIEAALDLSILAGELHDSISEIDVNPLLVSRGGLYGAGRFGDNHAKIDKPAIRRNPDVSTRTQILSDSIR